MPIKTRPRWISGLMAQSDSCLSVTLPWERAAKRARRVPVGTARCVLEPA